MDLDDLKLELNRLLSGVEHRPEDRHELHMMLQEKLGEMRAMGMPIPDDLLRFEAELEEAEDAEGTEEKR
ncbi:MAG: hypothetical protein AAF563_12580 [Pseudomonadota bacterium]